MHGIVQFLKDKNGIEGWYELDPYPGRFQKIYKKSFDIKDNMYREDDAVSKTVPITFINR